MCIELYWECMVEKLIERKREGFLVECENKRYVFITSLGRHSTRLTYGVRVFLDPDKIDYKKTGRRYCPRECCYTPIEITSDVSAEDIVAVAIYLPAKVLAVKYSGDKVVRIEAPSINNKNKSIFLPARLVIQFL